MAATLLELRNRVLVYLNDLQDSVTGVGDRYKTQNLNIVINDSIRHYVKVLNSYYQGYLSTNLLVDLLANTKVYPLPNTFRTPIYHIRRIINNVEYYLDPFQPYHTVLDLTPISNSEFIPRFWLEGNNLCFTQVPASNEISGITIKHQKKIIPLVMDTDELDDQLYDADDCIVLRTVKMSLGAKDVSGGLKNLRYFDDLLKDSETAFHMQVGNRYVKPDRPIPIQNEEVPFF